MNRLRVSAFFLVLALLVSSASAAEAPRHDIRVTIDAASGQVDVTDRVQIPGQASFDFRLAPWLDIERLRVNGKRAQAQDAGGGYRLALPDANAHEIEFELAGQLPARVDGGTAGSSHAADGSFLPACHGPVDSSRRTSTTPPPNPSPVSSNPTVTRSNTPSSASRVSRKR